MGFKKTKKYKAFSLMEMMVTMFIFCLMMLAVVAIFSSIVSARRNASQTQNDLEGARTVIEAMAKNLRMSKNAGPAGTVTEIKMYSNAQGKCVSYKFSGTKLEAGSKSGGPNDCSGSGYSYADMIPDGVSSGKFYVVSTNKTSNPPKIGRATVSMNIGGKYLQTTVSFRDYEDIIQ